MLRFCRLLLWICHSVVLLCNKINTKHVCTLDLWFYVDAWTMAFSSQGIVWLWLWKCSVNGRCLAVVILKYLKPRKFDFFAWLGNKYGKFVQPLYDGFLRVVSCQFFMNFQWYGTSKTWKIFTLNVRLIRLYWIMYILTFSSKEELIVSLFHYIKHWSVEYQL